MWSSGIKAPSDRDTHGSMRRPARKNSTTTSTESVPVARGRSRRARNRRCRAVWTAFTIRIGAYRLGPASASVVTSWRSSSVSGSSGNAEADAASSAGWNRGGRNSVLEAPANRSQTSPEGETHGDNSTRVCIPRVYPPRRCQSTRMVRPEGYPPDQSWLMRSASVNCIARWFKAAGAADEEATVRIGGDGGTAVPHAVEQEIPVAVAPRRRRSSR